MKLLRTVVLTFLAASIPMAVTVVRANSVVLTQGNSSYDVGGEFTATTSQSFLNNYVPSTIVNGGFETFCVETTVNFTPGFSYSYNLSNTDSLGRQLTEGAAFLYYEFAKGTLTGYVYNNTAQRQADAGLLQAAIWYLQGKQTYSDGKYTTPTINNNSFYALAINTFGSINATNANNGQYGVDVLQMWDGRSPAQNQLVLVPDAGMTAGLLGMGLVGVLLVQSRRRKSS